MVTVTCTSMDKHNDKTSVNVKAATNRNVIIDNSPEIPGGSDPHGNETNADKPTVSDNAVTVTRDTEANVCYKLVRVCRGNKTLREFYQCPSCHVELPEVENVRSHHEKIHPTVPCDTLKLDTIGTEIAATDPQCTSVTSKSRVKCPYCLSTLSSISHLQRHVVSLHYNRLAVTDATTGDIKRASNGDVECTEGDVKKCVGCRSTFTSNADLDRHLSLHKDVICYLCDHCELAFGRLLDLAKHMLEHAAGSIEARRGEEPASRREEGPGLYKTAGANPVAMVYRPGRVHCPYCPAVISSVDHLNTHIVRYHLERIQTTVTRSGNTCESENGNTINNKETEVERNTEELENGRTINYTETDTELKKDSNMCIVCPMGFSKKSDLCLHLADHKDVIYYQCALCDVSFKKLLGLVKHMVVHCVMDAKHELEGSIGESCETKTIVQVGVRDKTSRLSETGSSKKRKVTHPTETNNDNIRSETNRISEPRGKKKKLSNPTEANNSTVIDEKPKSKGKERNVFHQSEIQNDKKSSKRNYKRRRKKYFDEDGAGDNEVVVNQEQTKVHVATGENSKMKKIIMLAVTIPETLNKVGGSDGNECPHCQFSCKRRSAMKFHINMHHLSPSSHDQTMKALQEAPVKRLPVSCVKVYKCVLCQETFNLYNSHRAHMASHRTKGRRLVCHVCHQIFTTSSMLKDHLKTQCHSVTTSSVDTDGEPIAEAAIADTQTGRMDQLPTSDATVADARAHTATFTSVTAVPPVEEMQPACSQPDSHLESSWEPVEGQESACSPTEEPGSREPISQRQPSRRPGRSVTNPKSTKSHPSPLTSHCDQCGKVYSSRQALRYHVRKHHSDKQPTHTCDVCSRSFWLACELRDHRREVHSSETPYICDVCGKGYPTSRGMLRHLAGHRDQDDEDAGVVRPPVTCDICGFTIRSRFGRQLLYKHIHRSHPETVQCGCEICSAVYDETNAELMEKVKGICVMCNQCFCLKRYSDSHMRTVHFKFMAHECKFCTARFETPKMLSNHVNKDHEIDKQSFQNSLPQSSVGSKENISCVQDSFKVGENDSESFMHMVKSNKSDMPQYLPNLSEAHLDTVIKQLRVKNNDTAVSPFEFKCLLCQRCFAKGKYVNEHIRRSHVKNENQPYRCKVCGSGFIRIAEFQKHSRTHSNFRPYKCRHCKKSFKQLSNLKEHEVIHSNGHSEKCLLCKKTFKLRGTLISHVLNHCKLHPFKCPFCHKAYPDRGQLSRHMKQYLRTKEKDTHMCHICSETFSMFPLLSDHLFTHNPSRPFTCGVCQDSFRSFVQIYFHKAKTDHFTQADFEGIQEVNDDISDQVITSGELPNAEFKSDDQNIECHSVKDGLLEQSSEINQINSESFISDLKSLNSESEIMIETVGIEAEEEVFSVPDDILTVARQLTELSGQTASPDNHTTQQPQKDDEQVNIEKKEQELLFEMLDIDDDKRKQLVKHTLNIDHNKSESMEEVRNTDSEKIQFPAIVALTETINYDETATLETATVSYDNELEEMEDEVATETLYSDSQYLQPVTQPSDAYGTTEGIELNIADVQGNNTIVQSDLIEVCITDDQAVGQQIVITNQDEGLGTEIVSDEAGNQFVIMAAADENVTYEAETDSVIMPTEDNLYHVQVVNSADTSVDNNNSEPPQNVIDMNMISDQNSYIGTMTQTDQELMDGIGVETEVLTDDSASMMNINVKQIQSINGRFPCPLCPSRTKSRKYLREHLQRHQGESQKLHACEHPGCNKKFFQRTDLRRHLLVHTDKRPHECDICHKWFRQTGTLQSHRRVHTGDRPYSCTQPGCSLCFVTSTLLKSHIIRAHNEERHFVCTFCDKSFKDRHSFLVHIGSKHSGGIGGKEEGSNTNKLASTRSSSMGQPAKTIRTFICDQCGIETSSKAKLDTHITTHSDAKPFICHVCGDSFRTLRMVNDHVSVKHSDGRTKPRKRTRTYECPSCKRVFKGQGGYAYHIGSSEDCRNQLVLPAVDVPIVRVLI